MREVENLTACWSLATCTASSSFKDTSSYQQQKVGCCLGRLVWDCSEKKRKSGGNLFKKERKGGGNLPLAFYPVLPFLSPPLYICKNSLFCHHHQHLMIHHNHQHLNHHHQGNPDYHNLPFLELCKSKLEIPFSLKQ